MHLHMKELISLELQAITGPEQSSWYSLHGTHHCSHRKSLSAEFIMNCTKAGLPCMHSCMHIHTHTRKQTPSNFPFVHSRNGFRKEWTRLLRAQRENVFHKLTFLFAWRLPCPQALVCDKACAFVMRISHVCCLNEDVQYSRYHGFVKEGYLKGNDDDYFVF